MQITFSPLRCDDTLTVEKTGDTLTINGEDFDFTGLPDGATLPSTDPETGLSAGVPCEWIIGPVHRIDGEIHLMLILPYSSSSAPKEVRFPQPLTDVPDGPVTLPGGGDVDT